MPLADELLLCNVQYSAPSMLSVWWMCPLKTIIIILFSDGNLHERSKVNGLTVDLAATLNHPTLDKLLMEAAKCASCEINMSLLPLISTYCGLMAKSTVLAHRRYIVFEEPHIVWSCVAAAPGTYLSVSAVYYSIGSDRYFSSFFLLKQKQTRLYDHFYLWTQLISWTDCHGSPAINGRL